MQLTPGFESGFHVNKWEGDKAALRDGSVPLEYCKLNMMLFKPGSVLQFDISKGICRQWFQQLNQVLNRLALKYGKPISYCYRLGVTLSSQDGKVVGTINPKHLIEASQASHVNLTRKGMVRRFTRSREWFRKNAFKKSQSKSRWKTVFCYNEIKIYR